MAAAAQAAEAYEEDAEWRQYEGQVHLAQLEALRASSSHLAADFLEDSLHADALP